MFIYDSLLNDRLILNNPFTGDYKKLPKFIEFEEQQVISGFGFHPITKEYKAIKIVYYSNTYSIPSKIRNVEVWMLCRSDVQIFSLSRSKCRSIGEVHYFLDTKSTGVLVKGRLHWLSKRRRQNGHFERSIVSLDLDDERFGQVPRPNFSFNQLDRSAYHLAVIGGCLSAV
ncbi:F-box protein At3g07870-like [Nicotiana tabacum]|uniref:F-box protein At3g07870-like n=2 Tax=Nicotiana TaxID=4085 RepID=A0AC58U698_TOBAC|nr:PREDICTED: F-box protein At3g07870-like [Nicotiana sylvestris]